MLVFTDFSEKFVFQKVYVCWTFIHIVRKYPFHKKLGNNSDYQDLLRLDNLVHSKHLLDKFHRKCYLNILRLFVLSMGLAMLAFQ